MSKVKAYAAYQPKEALKPFDVERRSPGKDDVVIEIKYCGICHSDIHQAREEWGDAIFPMVPGHEIAGVVTEVGSNVSRFKAGDKVGVGCFVDSCRDCDPCHQGEEQYCEKGMNLTYNGREKDGETPTYGGYSQGIVVDQHYVLKLPDNIPLEKAAPLLCAGITTYSPLMHWNIKPGDKVAIVGLGGLGHMAVKIASAMGAEVSVLSTSESKKEDALKFGAKHFINTKEKDAFEKHANTFKLIINTAAGNTDINQYLGLVARNGTMVLIGVPEKPAELSPFNVIKGRKSVAGSLIGGIKETQEMLDFCSKHDIAPETEVISADKINEAYEKMMNGKVRYRFVIDSKTF